MKIAAQLYTVRHFMKTPEEIEQGLRKIKHIGYNAVQVSGLGDCDPLWLKRVCDENGLKICATHMPFAKLQENIDEVIELHRTWDCKYVGLGSMPKPWRQTREGFIEFAREAAKIGRKLHEAGLTFIYHNHHFEFVRFDGQLGMELLLAEMDPEFFELEIDVYWVQAGGADPAEWIRKMKGRLHVVHLKDMVLDKEEKKPFFAEVGAGNMNFRSILDACREAGVQWCAVEQDKCLGDPFESLATSFHNLKDMGLGS